MTILDFLQLNLSNTQTTTNIQKKDIFFFLKHWQKKYKSSLITTQKDAVKLTKFSDREIYALKLKTEIYPGPYTEKSFEETVTESFFKYKSSH